MSSVGTCESQEFSRILKPLGDSTGLLDRKLSFRNYTFSILQFNILADSFSYAFPLVDPQYLAWEHRKPLLIKEMLRCQPCVMCLEEVDHFDEFEEELGKYNYKGIFKKKSSDDNKDGCAIFYNTDVFTYLDHKAVDFKDYIENANQVAIICSLMHKPSRRKTCITVTHLKAKEPFEDLRVKEINCLLELIDNFKKENNVHHMVLAGDFNSTPDNRTYSSVVESPLSLKSAYCCNWSGEMLEVSYTSLKKRPPATHVKTIDYIFYSEKTLTPLCLLDVPSIQDIPEDLLPCKEYPSDHLALYTELSIQ